jgi:hypothetical protein
MRARPCGTFRLGHGAKPRHTRRCGSMHDHRSPTPWEDSMALVAPAVGTEGFAYHTSPMLWGSLVDTPLVALTRNRPHEC